MRILLASTNRAVVGGIETYLQSLVPALLRRGHEVALVYQRRCQDESETIDPPGRTIPIWYGSELLSSSAPWREIADWNPDVVYAHCPESLDLEERLLARYSSVLYIHNYWGTCTTGRKCHDLPNTRACNRKFGLACLALHYPRRCGGLNPLTALQMFRETGVRKSRLKEYRKILVASSHMRREYERNGVNPNCLHMVPCPLTDSSLELAPYSPKELGGSLLFAGRLTTLKGVDYLMRAIPEAANRLGRALTLTVMGDGPDRARLEALAQQSGIAARFVGWLDGDRKLSLMRESNLLVVPSLWPEPFGLVGIEAGCLSVPAAAYGVGGVPDWLIPGVTGELASGEPPTVAGLAAAMVAALSHSNHYERLCRGAWEWSRQFTMVKHLTELERLLQEVVSDRVVPETLASRQSLKIKDAARALDEGVLARVNR